MHTFTMIVVDCANISASDLRYALHADPAARNARCLHIDIEDESGHESTAQAITFAEGTSGRIGIATNADAQWGDFTALQGPLDCWAAINDYLNDADAWEARN